MLWSDFILGVTQRLTETLPTEATFTEAQAAYVKARLVLDNLAPRQDTTAIYTLNQNRYTSLRRKLAGFLTTQSPTTQQANVSALVTSGTATDKLFESAVTLYLKAQIARDLENDAELAVQFLAQYEEMKFKKLLGYQYTGSTGTLTANVTQRLISTTTSPGNATYISDMVLDSYSALMGIAASFNANVAAAAADLQSLNNRVVNEIRAAVIRIQEIIPGYQVGQVSTFNRVNTSQIGHARTGVLPPQAQIQEARIIQVPNPGAVGSIVPLFQSSNPPLGTAARLLVDSKSDPVTVIPWEQRYRAMVERRSRQRMISISPDCQYFMVPNDTLNWENMLSIEWNGLALNFINTDTVPFDEGVMQAAGFYVQAELALEFGDPEKTVADYRQRFLDRQSLLKVEMDKRGSVEWAHMRPGGNWPESASRDRGAFGWNQGWPENQPNNCDANGFPWHKHKESSVWLQLLDTGTNAWRTLSFSAGVLVTGDTTPHVKDSDWPQIIDTNGLTDPESGDKLGVRTNGGFVQIFDTTDLAWRSVWCNNGVLVAGADDKTQQDNLPATAFRIYTVGQVVTLQLLDQASGTQFRSMLLTNGVLTFGPLQS